MLFLMMMMMMMLEYARALEHHFINYTSACATAAQRDQHNEKTTFIIT